MLLDIRSMLRRHREEKADGKDMASKGMVKPSAEVVDAMARRRYAEVKEFGADAAFKQNYKSGFWEGWRAGD